jgi:hypothetical protein
MQNSDICLSVRSIKSTASGEPGSLACALALIDRLRPSRLEWSYTWRSDDTVAQLKERVPVFVAALNTISPPGHAVSFEGDPVVAPWMKAFGTPATRPTYMCQNNPDDAQARIDQSLEIIGKGLTDSFQHDDWYCNAQMLEFGNPCFCEHCVQEFSRYLGFAFEFDYRAYLGRRGIVHTRGLLALAEKRELPLWEDYRRFQQQTVTRYFRRLRAAMDRYLGRAAVLSVNGSVCGFGGRIETVLPFVSYLHGETPDFSPAALKRLAIASREAGVRQVVSFFPDVDAAAYDDPAFVGRVNQAIGVCYCLGLLPLFPYDVYAGDRPRWYGTWEQYGRPYAVVREHPDWFDGYAWKRMRLDGDRVVIRTVPTGAAGPALEHELAADGAWQTKEV